MPRLIGTGSRAFTDRALVFDVLAKAREVYGPDLIVVYGVAGRGADQLIRQASKALGLELDPHPADWTGPCRPACRPGHRKRRRDLSTYCPAAGVYRNQAMVDRGADACVAFLVEPSISACEGTRDTMRRAAAAQIPVTAYPVGIAVVVAWEYAR